MSVVFEDDKEANLALADVGEGRAREVSVRDHTQGGSLLLEKVVRQGTIIDQREGVLSVANISPVVFLPSGTTGIKLNHNRTDGRNKPGPSCLHDRRSEGAKDKGRIPWE